MAIDSRDKRSSAIHTSLPWRGMFPLADGSIGQADREAVALLYGGIAVSQVLADSEGDPNVFYRQAEDQTIYGRQGATDTTYSRSGGTDTSYPRQ